ncbi:hypothetical protein EYB26_005991 [Talaromyces marneffei]|uniref:uncharacterized protein n=1 Tax=Talaromyces marneffei TaxID=37727 RepID=UPI0012A86B11|nr:uncharacterized protein EYB26_005991 [Talaromyces marneffei]QGA18307.1 hypothetical protein EYB26_005991 [Talaromyces marneffei]
MFFFRALRIIKDAIFARNLPLHTRFHLLLLQPTILLTYTIEWTISRKFPHSEEILIPLKRAPGQSVRAIIYIPKSAALALPGKKVPLHLNIHGGAFLGGLPEGSARFCAELAEKSGAVVVSTAYRYAPVHTFPDAHEDVQDVVEYLTQNAERLWNADARIFTVSGFSVGGNLALAVAQGLAGTEFEVKGFDDVDFRLPPWLKPKPPGYPEKDPLAFLQPLFDAYAGPNRNMLFIIGGVDILRNETTTMTERLQAEAEAINQSRQVSKTTERPDGTAVVVRTDVYEGQIHGWLEMPSFAIDVNTRTKAFDDAIKFLRHVHQAYGFENE